MAERPKPILLPEKTVSTENPGRPGKPRPLALEGGAALSGNGLRPHPAPVRAGDAAQPLPSGKPVPALPPGAAGGDVSRPAPTPPLPARAAPAPVAAPGRPAPLPLSGESPSSPAQGSAAFGGAGGQTRPASIALPPGSGGQAPAPVAVASRTPAKSTCAAAPPVPVLAPDSSIRRGLDANLVTAEMLNPYRPMAPADETGIREMVARIDMTDTGAVMSFGDTAQSAASAVSGGLLKLGRGKQTGIHESLRAIRDAVAGLTAEDILGRHGHGAAELAADLLGHFLRGRGSDPRERLRGAIALVEAETKRIESVLPGIAGHVTQLDALADEARSVHRQLRIHAAAAEIAVKVYRDGLRPVLERRAAADPEAQLQLRQMDFSADVLERRAHALAGLRAQSQQDPAQIELMKNTYVALAEAARGTILDLVGSWRRSCGAAMALMDARRAEGLGSAAGDILTSRDRIVEAIDAADGA